MSPPISKEWWIAAAITGASVPAAQGQQAAPQGQQQIGVVATSKAGAPGKPATVSYAPLYSDGKSEPRIKTDAGSSAHVMLTDQSAITIGPNSDFVIKLYEHDAQKKTGNVVIEMAVGLMRYVGGQISKRNGATVRTQTATIGIRGGITMVETNGQNTSGTFLFGQQMSATDTNGNTQTVTRAGFGTSFGGNQPPSTPQRIPVNQINGLLNRLESNPGGQQTGGGGQPGGAPPGQLLSTSNTPGGGQNPGGTLANDRLKNVVDTNAGANPSQTLRNILTTPIPNQS